MSGATPDIRIATRRGVLVLAVAAIAAAAALVAAAVTWPLPSLGLAGLVSPQSYHGIDLTGGRLLVLAAAVGWPLLTLLLVFGLRRLWRPRTVFWARSAMTLAPVRRPPYAMVDGLTDAAVLGLAAGVGTAVAFDLGAVGVAAIALTVVAALALATGREAEGLARAVAGLAPLGPALLAVASERTAVTVVETGAGLPHPWFPAWLAAALAVLGWIAVLRLGAERAARPVAMLWTGLPLAWLLTAALPGEIGSFALRSEAETLVAAFAVLDGRWPWAELSMIHGPWIDAGRALVGMTVFEPTRWGAAAGLSVILAPALLAGSFALFAWLSGWRWPHAALATLAAGWIAPGGGAELVLWAPTLAVLALLLVRGTAVRALLLVGLALAQALLVPATLTAAAAAAAVVVLRDLCGGEPARQRFRRTVLCACWAVPPVLVAAPVLLATGLGRQLRPLALFFDAAGPVDHGRLAGGAFGLDTVSATVVIGLALMAVAMVAGWSILARRGLDPRDGVAAAAGLFALSALPGAAGGDAIGLSQAAAVPVMAVAVRLLAAVEARAPRPPAVPHPVVLTALLLAVAAAAVWPRGGFALDPETLVRRLRPTVVAPGTYRKLGYADPGAVDTALLDGWQLLLDGWVAPGGRVLDLTGRPGLFHMLLGYRPTGRFLHGALAVRPADQDELAAALQAEKPEAVIVPTARDADGIPATVRLHRLSRAVLEHYVPVVAFPDGVMFVPRGTELADPSLYVQAVACDWGQAAAAGLALDPPVAGPSEWPARTLSGPETVRFEGRLDPPAAGGAVDLVVALLDGRPIADTVPDVAGDRFRITVQVPRGAGRRVRLVAALADGDMRPIDAVPGIGFEGEAGPGGFSAGRIESREIAVHDGVRQLPPLDGETSGRPGLRVVLEGGGPGVRHLLGGRPPWARDGARDGARDAIAFVAAKAGRTVVPVAACPQWWGFGGGPLYLWTPGGGAVPTVAWEIGPDAGRR